MQNTLPPLPLVDGALFVDNSMLELLTTCPRALQYNKLNQRISASDKPSLNFGSAIHEALEYRYAVYKNNAPDPYCFEDQHAILTEFFDAHVPPVDDWRNLSWAVEVNKKYNDLHMTEPFNLLKYDEPIECPKCGGKGEDFEDASLQATIPCRWCRGTGKRDIMVELSFALPLFTHDSPELRVPVIYTGRIDLPVLQDGGLFVMDHKTTSLLGPTFFERMSMSAQQTGYCWAFAETTGKPVTGYIINALRTKEPPQYVLQGGKGKQTPEQWWSESFQRERYYVNAAKIAEWKNNTINLIEEFFWHYSRGYMPMKTSWCCQFGRCQYLDACSLPESSRGVMLSSGLYTDNKWSPLKEPSQSKQ